MASVHQRRLSEELPPVERVGEIELTTLDQFCAGKEIRHVDFLKLDIEGNELAALRGASGLLGGGEIDAIQFEFGGTNVDSRTFLRDFVSLLGPSYSLYRILADGLEDVRYGERSEIFVYANFVATRRESGPAQSA